MIFLDVFLSKYLKNIENFLILNEYLKMTILLYL